MQKLAIGISSNRGFSLIEILVVLVIVGITMTFALMAFGDFGGSRRAQMAAEQFVHFVHLMQHQAVLETRTMGIKVDRNGYQAWRYLPNSTWQAFPQSTIFRRYAFPASVQLHLQSAIVTLKQPQIIINETGDMNPFQLDVVMKSKTIVTVIGYPNGSLELLKKESL